MILNSNRYKYRALVPLLLIVALFASQNGASAQNCTEDQEPNNEPATAQPIDTCATGTLEDGDQDFYQFELTGPLSSRQITLDGVSRALTRAELFALGDDGRPRSIYTVQSPNGDPVTSPSLLLGPGRYFLGVAPAGGVGTYEVILEPGEPPPPAVETEPNDRREEPTPVSGAFAIGGDGQGSFDFYSWTLSEADAAQSWTITAQIILDQPLVLTLFNTTGQRLATATQNAAGRASFYDLQLPAGTYALQIDANRGEPAPYYLTATAEPALPPIRESEPNDDRDRPFTWGDFPTITGRLAGHSDKDTIALTISEDQAGQRFDLNLTTNGRQDRVICLETPTEVPSHCRTGRGQIAMPDLSLPAGTHILDIDGAGNPDAFYSLTRTETGTAGPGEEQEPNDDYRLATPLDPDLRGSGRLDGDEWDIFELQVSGSPQLWRIQAVGDGLNRLAYINAAGKIQDEILLSQPQRRLRLTNLYLLPGTHFIGIRGTDSHYRLMAIPLGPPPSGLEREPNSREGQSNPLRFDEQRIGLVSETGDNDYYQFTLAAEEAIRLTVTAPDDGNVQVRILGEGNFRIANATSDVEPGEPFIWENRLPPGEYWVQLRSDIISDSAYTVQLERLNPFAALDDIEPNDSPDLAAPFPPSFVAQGAVDQFNDIDFYRLPELTQPTDLTLTIGENHSLQLYDESGSNITGQFEFDRERGRLTGTASPGVHFIRIGEDGPYELRLDLAGVNPPQSEPVALDGDITLELDSDAAASFSPVGQQVTGRVLISGSAAGVDQLTWHTPHYKIQPPRILDASEVSGRREIRFALDLMADIPTGRHPITVQVADGQGGLLTAQAILELAPTAPAVAAQHVWPLPPEMLGGLNAADLALGARIATADPALAERQASLHDGYTPLNAGFVQPFASGPIELTIELAGGSPAPVAGILLNPQGRGRASEKLQDFELALSMDGASFTTVLTGRLHPIDVEQAFALDQPVDARFARLRLVSNQDGNIGPVALGEWKVVLSPGFSWLGELNLLDIQAGGQLVFADPQPNGEQVGVGTLITDGNSRPLRLDNGQSAIWVTGFQHGRAAQLTRMEWVENPATDPTERLTSVRVLVSQASPAGPWREISRLDLAPGTTGLNFSEPVWARFVRFEATGPGGERFRPLGPDAIRLFERQHGGEYRSILGEWGHYSQAGIFEALTPPAVPAPAETDRNDSREQAQPVQPGEQITGQVTIGQDDDWYRIDVPDDNNAIILELSGTPTVDVRAIFEDESGQLLPAAVENPEIDRRIVTVGVPAGSTVYFRIEEPPRSVVFAWDQSGSVGPFLDTIYSSLAAFVEGVTPGLETANFLPFGGQLLLDTWGEQPAALQQALNDYPRTDGSSNSEKSLLTAVDELAFQEGTRAIVLITDAVSPGYNETAGLWRALEAVQPRIFTVSTNSGLTVGNKPANEQDLMQNWAAVNAGHYDFLRTQAEMALAFERATAWLRRPAGYSFVAQPAFIDPPGPGSLQLLSSAVGENAAASASLLGDTAVEIIVDASGSMQQPLGNSTRIEVARSVLDELVSDILPDDLPVALRAFGNREGNFSCRTDLEMPLQPLDRAALSEAIAGITPQNDANTAIGASLALVPDDLAGVDGPKLVILLTDGEETCGGNPQQVIEDLRARGIDVRVNVVGFAIDNADLKAEFSRWAEAGGGEYFDAADSEGLSDSLSEALRTPYRVLDETGAVVAEGTVDGDPLELPAGVYTIEILSDPASFIEDVIVPGEQAVVVRVKADP